MSGHSKWATIKRKKGATDAARGKVFTKLIRELVTAARVGGSGDPASNSRLRKAINDAKAQQMPADTIKRAIQRGTGELDGAAFEEVLYEGTGPGGSLFLVEVMTDNRNRTVAELRKVFERHNGALGSSGTAAWAFDHLGLMTLEKSQVSEETLMEAVLGAGADDYRDEGDQWLVCTPPDQLDRVTSGLEQSKLPIQESKLGYLPKVKKPLAGREAEVCLGLFETLDEHDDVQKVFADFDVSDEDMQRIAAG